LKHNEILFGFIIPEYYLIITLIGSYKIYFVITLTLGGYYKSYKFYCWQSRQAYSWERQLIWHEPKDG